jgi:hypothetical protein
MSVLFVGAYSWSFSLGAPQMSCSALVTNTHVYLLSITIKGSSFQNSMALSSEWYPFILIANYLTQFEISETGQESQGGISYASNVSSWARLLPFCV